MLGKQLPVLDLNKLEPTRDYLQDVAKAMGSFQRAFLAKHPRDWHYGLELSLRGIITQPIGVAGEETRLILDFVTNKLRIGDIGWQLDEYSQPELFNNLKLWLAEHVVKADLPDPQFEGGQQYDQDQATVYAEALWWMEQRFKIIKAGLSPGLTAPILLYPHHFDLSLVWFPYDDEKQLAIGFSTGDANIPEPYVYLTAWPEPAKFTSLKLPKAAHWQSEGFSGAILPYAKLRATSGPEDLLQEFASQLFQSAYPLFK